MISDLRAAGYHPGAILVSEFDKRDLKHEIMALSGEVMDDAEDTEQRAICIIEGIPVVSNKTIERGKARILPQGPTPQKKITNDLINRSVKVA